MILHSSVEKLHVLNRRQRLTAADAKSLSKLRREFNNFLMRDAGAKLLPFVEKVQNVPLSKKELSQVARIKAAFTGSLYIPRLIKDIQNCLRQIKG